MKKFTANDSEIQSTDILAENIARFKELFPEADIERKVKLIYIDPPYTTGKDSDAYDRL